MVLLKVKGPRWASTKTYSVKLAKKTKSHSGVDSWTMLGKT